MKSIMVVIAVVLAVAEASVAQNVNWRSLRGDQQNIFQLHFGYEFGATAQAAYSRSLTIVRPVVLGLDVSLPMGNDPLDDFKVRTGGQVELVEVGDFLATVKISSVLRRYHTDLVRVVSFGSDLGLVAGYYKSSWFAAGEFGFDKAIATNLKHSEIMKAVYPAIRDGWYLPTGGHYYYGLQAGKTLGDVYDLSLRLGGTRAQESDENAVLPVYLQLGMGVRF